MTEKPHGVTSQQLHTMGKEKMEIGLLQAAELKIKDFLKKGKKVRTRFLFYSNPNTGRSNLRRRPKPEMFDSLLF